MYFAIIEGRKAHSDLEKPFQPTCRPTVKAVVTFCSQFIDERLDLLNSGRGFNDEFEIECNSYADKVNTGSAQRLKQQYRDWAKNFKKEGGALFRSVKNKVGS